MAQILLEQYMSDVNQSKEDFENVAKTDTLNQF